MKVKNDLSKNAEALSVNQDEAEKASTRARVLSSAIDDLENNNSNQSERLDSLLNSIESLDLASLNLDSIDLAEDNVDAAVEGTSSHALSDLRPLTYMETVDDLDDLLSESTKYAEKCNLNIDNPYLFGLSEVEINQMSSKLSEKYEMTQLDKWDYVFAGCAGIIGGLIDAFLVGSITDGNNPKTVGEQGKLGKVTDNVVVTLIKKYASFESKTPMTSKSKAIRWLEKNHKVSYDASNNSHVMSGAVKGMNPSNHHLLSLAHDPGPLGLLFGILDQLDGKSSFISDGHLVREVTDSAESLAVTSLDGPQKVIGAIQNWFGHICSDVAGTSTSKGRGAGLPAPFYELTQQLRFGSVSVNGKDKSYAQVSEWLYKQGLDFRAFVAQSLPVLVTETLVRLYWVYKKHFYYGKKWKESLPIANQMDLQKLLLTAIATFETTDIADAILRNGFNVTALLRINFAGVLDLTFRSIQVLRSEVQKNKRLNKLDEDLQQEWNRIYQTI